MQHSKFIFLIFLISLLALFFPVPTMADAAPPDVPDGENINPGEGTTMVQMVAEEVIIDVGLTRDVIHDFNDGYYLEGYIVAYTCRFWLENKGSETENLAVRFPINSGGEYGKINIQSIKVNGRLVSWVEDEIDRMKHFNWAHFNVEFPPGEEVEIKVTYTTVTYGWPHAPHHRLSYVLETGAGWYRAIEKGRIILRLPYKATSENVFNKYFETTEMNFTDSDVYWEFSDLEPTSKDNWGVQIVVPDLWLEILATRNKLENSPNNFSALYRLAEYISAATLYKGVDIYSHSLYEEGLEAIILAISLNPKDIKSRELFTWYLQADMSMENALLILKEVDTILELDPKNKIAQYRKEDAMRNLEFWQTLTETANVTPTPAITPIPTATLKPNSPTPTRDPVQDSSPLKFPTQLVTLEEKEEVVTSNTQKTYNQVLISILIILLLLGGTAAIKTINRR